MEQKINELILEELSTLPISVDDGLGYLLCLHYGINPSYLPTGIFHLLKRIVVSMDNKLIKKGLISFYDRRMSVEQMQSVLLKSIPKDDEYSIVMTDHLRKLLYKDYLKKTIDDYSSMSVDLRNAYGFSFVHIIHLNRSISEGQRIRQFGNYIYPTSEDIKDTGNLSEDADYVFTIFNPNDMGLVIETATKYYGNIN